MNWAPPQLPILLIDVDGVLADFVTPFLRYINEVLGSSWTKDDITEHDIEDCFGLSYEERNEVRMHIDRMRMARTLAPLPGAVEAMKRLSESAHILFVTASLTSSQTWEWDRRAWLTDLFGEGWGKKAQFVKDKWAFQGDIFIDDSPSNVEKWATYNRWNHDKTPIIWDQWYNADFNEKDFPAVVRSNNWGYVESLCWEKTNKKDAIVTWIERNDGYLHRHAMQYVAVNPYVGVTLWAESVDELTEKMKELPQEIRKDMSTWFNAVPVPWLEGKDRTKYDL